MISGFEEANFEQMHRLENLKKLHSKWKVAFFSMLSGIYNQSTSNFQHQTGNAEFYVLNLATFGYISSILWTQNISIQSWSNYRNLWVIPAYLRLDVLAVQFSFSETILLGICSLYLLVLCLCMLIFLSRLIFKKNLKKLSYVTSKLLKVIKFGNLSCFLFLSIILKYSWTNATPTEYLGNSVSMNFSNWGIFLSLLSMLFLVIIEYCEAEFNCDYRHYEASLSIEAMAYNQISMSSLRCNYLSMLLYTFLSSGNFVAYRLIIFALHGPMAIMYAYFLPYFSFKANFVKSWCHANAALSSFLMIIAYYIDNALFCIYGICIIMPIVLVIWYHLLVYRISKIKDMKVNDIWELELTLREKLINYQEHEEKAVLYQFQMIFEKSNCKKYRILVLWEFDYIYYSCMQEQLAFYKLSQKVNVGESIGEEYHEYVRRSNISANMCNKYDEYNYIDEICRFEKVKRLDKKSCILAYKFWAHITSNKAIGNTLEIYSKDLSTCMNKLKTKYSHLSQRFPNSARIVELYSSFLNSFYKDHEITEIPISRKDMKGKTKCLKEDKNDSIFSQENPTFFISACGPDLGKILYSNSSMSELMHTSELNFISQPIKIYFPVIFSFFQEVYLKKFTKLMHSSTIYLDENLFMLDPKGFLVEVHAVVILLGSINPLFICVCIPIEIIRAAALVTKEGEILYHTENFMTVLGVDFELKGHRINSLAEINLQELKKSKSCVIKIINETYFVNYRKIEIKKIVIRVIYLSKSSNPAGIKHSCSRLSIKEPSRRVSFLAEEHFKEENTLIQLDDSFKNRASTKELLEHKISTATQSLNSISEFCKMSRYAAQSIQALKYFKIILFLAVMTT